MDKINDKIVYSADNVPSYLKEKSETSPKQNQLSIDFEELEQRVRDFNSCKLLGQPLATHLGTSYLVNDLWRTIVKLRRIIDG